MKEIVTIFMSSFHLRCMYYIFTKSTTIQVMWTTDLFIYFFLHFLVK